MAKRIFDILFSFALLLMSFPLMAIAFIGIRLTSKGPIFYEAARIGKDGALLTMYKFRTMHVNDGKGSAITSPNDARIFKFGAFLRASKIDELPQLYNIIKGDMSFVGPRPEDPSIVDKYYTKWMHETLAVRPGLTSPGTLYFMKGFSAAVSDDDAEQSYSDKILAPKLELDLKYIKTQTFIKDLGIIFETAMTVLIRLLSFKTKE
ncbi:MAG: sugar transferase [Nitratireductor sp.]